MIWARYGLFRDMLIHPYGHSDLNQIHIITVHASTPMRSFDIYQIQFVTVYAVQHTHAVILKSTRQFVTIADNRGTYYTEAFAVLSRHTKSKPLELLVVLWVVFLTRWVTHKRSTAHSTLAKKKELVPSKTRADSTTTYPSSISHWPRRRAFTFRCVHITMYTQVMRTTVCFAHEWWTHTAFIIRVQEAQRPVIACSQHAYTLRFSCRSICDFEGMSLVYERPGTKWYTWYFYEVVFLDWRLSRLSRLTGYIYVWIWHVSNGRGSDL